MARQACSTRWFWHRRIAKTFAQYTARPDRRSGPNHEGSLTGEATDQAWGSVGVVLEKGAVLVVTADERLAVATRNCDGRAARCAVVVAPEESAGAQALDALLAAPQSPEIVAVVTGRVPEGMRRPLVAAAATRHGLDVLPASTLRGGSFAESIRELDVDLLVNVHSLSVLGSDIVRAAPPALAASTCTAPGPAPGVRGS